HCQVAPRTDRRTRSHAASDDGNTSGVSAPVQLPWPGMDNCGSPRLAGRLRPFLRFFRPAERRPGLARAVQAWHGPSGRGARRPRATVRVIQSRSLGLGIRVVRCCLLGLVLALAPAVSSVRAEEAHELRIVKQPGLAYLPLIVMRELRL